MMLKSKLERNAGFKQKLKNIFNGIFEVNTTEQYNDKKKQTQVKT